MVCVDTFYIGQLKGVGKVWQITASDGAACSYGVAWLLPAHTAEVTAHFLHRVLRPLYHRVGWRLRRVLTDGGPEFKGAFDEACRTLGLRHTRTKPRHAWTNGFVERRQGTLLQEHWRVAFRRRYFTSRTALQRGLKSFMSPLRLPAAAPRLPRPGPHPRRALLGRCSGMTSYATPWMATVSTPFRVWTP